MTNKKPNQAPATGTVLFIPLNKLKKSPRNARKMPHPKADIEALAASIAANGILQNPVIEPERTGDGDFTGNYLVTIGEGRRQAQLLRAKRKEIAKTEPIRCLIESEANALEISLAENAIRSSMHPADQFEAFQILHTEQGMNSEDIAARFGVTPAIVRQRLKLAAVSPLLMKAYREALLDLEQLSAFAFTDDHARQEHVWDELGPDASRDEILELLNNEHVHASDQRVIFIGIEAYEAAGGTVLRDLFDEGTQGFLTDAGLLTRLVREKLDAMAETVKAEGWKWVAVMPEYDHAGLSSMRRVFGDMPELSEETLERMVALRDGLDAMEEYDADATQRVEDEIEALEGVEQYNPEDIARGGAVVAVGREGAIRIERGFIRPEDDDRKRAPETTGQAPALRPSIPDTLLAELTATRTSGLRNALAQHTDTALRAVVHALAEEVFFPHRTRTSCLQIRMQQAGLSVSAPAIDATASEQETAARQEAWARRMPENIEQLWAFVGTLSLQEQIALLAHCGSLSLNAVKRKPGASTGNADILAAHLGFDMASAWEPTPENYLGRVSKERILEAVSEGVSKEAADNLAKLKKHAMVEAAAKRLHGKGWLPPVLRTAPPLLQAAE